MGPWVERQAAKARAAGLAQPWRTVVQKEVPPPTTPGILVLCPSPVPQHGDSK